MYSNKHIQTGGSCIYVHKDLNAVEIKYIVDSSVCRICEISACYPNKVNLIIINVYRTTFLKMLMIL